MEISIVAGPRLFRDRFYGTGNIINYKSKIFFDNDDDVDNKNNFVINVINSNSEIDKKINYKNFTFNYHYLSPACEYCNNLILVNSRGSDTIYNIDLIKLYKEILDFQDKFNKKINIFFTRNFKFYNIFSNYIKDKIKENNITSNVYKNYDHLKFTNYELIETFKPVIDQSEIFLKAFQNSFNDIYLCKNPFSYIFKTSINNTRDIIRTVVKNYESLTYDYFSEIFNDDFALSYVENQKEAFEYFKNNLNLVQTNYFFNNIDSFCIKVDDDNLKVNKIFIDMEESKNIIETFCDTISEFSQRYLLNSSNVKGDYLSLCIIDKFYIMDSDTIEDDDINKSLISNKFYNNNKYNYSQIISNDDLYYNFNKKHFKITIKDLKTYKKITYEKFNNLKNVFTKMGFNFDIELGLTDYFFNYHTNDIISNRLVVSEEERIELLNHNEEQIPKKIDDFIKNNITHINDYLFNNMSDNNSDIESTYDIRDFVTNVIINDDRKNILDIKKIKI